MCAINGVTKNDGTLVRRMNERTKHRGPDGSSLYESGGVTLGHNRLSIIDTSDASSQPMKSTDGRYVIVYNGELYNYRELRTELERVYTFTSTGDTEVLLAAYSVWHEAMFPRLRGIFAFAIWDTMTEELVLARDHMGVKPLYYMHEDGVLTFSSEIPALLVGKEHPTLNTTSLAFYLGMEYVPGPQTLVNGVTKLRPGQLLRYKNGTITTSTFLTKSRTEGVVSSKEIYDTIDTAVKRQLVSDRPVGAYLSGGFDSSIVVHHMAKHSPHTRTYSVDFEAVQGQEEDSSKFNIDASLAEKTAAFYGTEHKKLTISLPDVRDTIENASKSANEPIANSTAITQFLLSDFVRRDGVIVVLGGDGGDELFGGYTRHRLATAAYLYQKLPHVLQRVGGMVYPRAGKLSTPFGTPLHKALMIKDEKKIQPFLLRDFDINTTVTHYFDEAYALMNTEGRHPIDTFMHVDRYTWLPDECFIRSDYAAMAHGIELRVPFVDLDVVALSDAISIWKKTLPHEGKRIIRSTYKPYLPSHLYHEPKRGWLSPAAKWFRDPVIHAFAKEVFSSGYYSGLDGVFDWKSVQNLLDAHVNKKGYYLYPLWNILVLQIWAREHGIISNRV
jgi:asparagine synthase (glutamine-hydrolysing)